MSAGGPAATATLLRLLGDMVAGLDEGALADLVSGRARLAVVRGASPTAAAQARSPKAVPLDAGAAAAVAEQVRQAPDRATAEAALVAGARTKAALRAVADAAGVTVSASLTVPRYRAALVERLLGYRLRSEALRG